MYDDDNGIHQRTSSVAFQTGRARETKERSYQGGIEANFIRCRWLKGAKGSGALPCVSFYGARLASQGPLLC